MLWYDMLWYDIIWYDIIWYDMIWYDIIWYDNILYNVIWYDMIWCDMTYNLSYNNMNQANISFISLTSKFICTDVLLLARRVRNVATMRPIYLSVPLICSRELSSHAWEVQKQIVMRYRYGKKGETKGGRVIAHHNIFHVRMSQQQQIQE